MGAALVAASAVWAAPKLGGLISQLRFKGYPFGPGAWATYLGVAVALAGGIVALLEMPRVTDPHRPTSARAIRGFVLGVFGVAVYVFATALPYERVSSFGSDVSYNQYSRLLHQSLSGTVAAALTVYGAASVIALISLGGVLARRLDLWAMALLAAALAWSPQLILLLYLRGSQGGFWGMEAAVVLLLIAGTVAVRSTNIIDPETAGPSAS